LFLIVEATIHALKNHDRSTGRHLNVGTPGATVANVVENNETEATDEDEEDEEGEECVYDIQSSDDSDLELQDDEKAILMYFFNNCNEVCDSQQEIFESLSAKWQGKVRFVTVDATHPDTAPIAAFHGIHNVPAFALRRKGEVTYLTAVGLKSRADLDAFVQSALAGTDTASAK
jgi:thioredoxin-like negative regulator of GroEL